MQIAEGLESRESVISRLRDKGYPVVDLTDNEMAKLHIRHMVGGPAPATLQNEIVYRFEFPERPGALMNFLNHLGQRWNISMFHYRSHGAAFGRVLVGLQVEPGERRELAAVLETVHYRFWEETDKPAYQLYLS